MRMGPASEDRGISILSEILKHKGEGTPPYAKIWGGEGVCIYLTHTPKLFPDTHCKLLPIIFSLKNTDKLFQG
jgi:hypothetical protein